VSGPAPTETEDRLLGGRVRLVQPAAGYRAAIDPVLLAAAVDAAPGEHVADLGCGAGAALLCLLARCPGVAAMGVERDPALADLARRNADANAVSDRASILTGDLATLDPPGAFDRVMTNPPYLPSRRGLASPDRQRAAATVETDLPMAAWIAAAAGWLKPRGWLVLIQRADRIDCLCAALLPAFGSVAIFPLWPKAGEPARRVLVRARKGGRAPAVLAAGFVLHGPAGRYTPEAESVLRDGAPLRF
jgi:tRNA1(Val) A37 N6-methylase TrmN6